MTVTYGDYLKELKAFSQKHNKKAELKIYTSPMVDNSYHKEYCWSDGANFYEITNLIEETVPVEVEAHGMKFTSNVTVKYWRTEYWSTEAPSKYFYERA